MEQFSLEKYLENPSRKVVTRRGNPVRIICTDRKHGEDNLPIVFLEQCHNGEFLLACRKDGRGDTYDTPYDLFFADEEELSEFDKCLLSAFYSVAGKAVMTIGPASFQEDVDEWSKPLLDLARKEILKEQDNCVIIPEDDYYEQLASQYHIGHEDALKSLPKWKKITKIEQNYLVYGYLSNDEYYLSIKELIENLPKEE